MHPVKEFFASLNQFYDKVYVLTVKSAAHRRERFATHFEGLDYEFFFGADKNLFSVEEVETNGIFSEKLTRQHHRFSKTMRHGEIACAWSHKMIYEDMLEKGHQRILIFEDDALPDPVAIKNIPAILSQLPNDAELLMWGWGKNGMPGSGSRLKQFIYHIQHRIGRLKWGPRIIDNLYARPHSTHIKKAGFHDYTYAYALSRSGAEKLLQMQSPIQYIADNLLAHAATTGTVQGYITWPQVFQHDSLPDGTPRDSYIR